MVTLVFRVDAADENLPSIALANTKLYAKGSTKKAPKVRRFHVVGPSNAARAATSNWRERSEGLRRACRAGRGVTEPDQSDTHCNQTAWTPEVEAVPSPDQNTTNFCNPATMLIEEKFNSLDVDKDGVLSREQMDGFLKSMYPAASGTELDLAFRSIDKDGDGFVDIQDFSACVLGGVDIAKKPAAGSALAHIRQKSVRNTATPQTTKRVANAPQMPKSDGFRRRPRSASLRSPVHPGAKTRRRSAGAARSEEPLPPWGSAEASWGRHCITSASEASKYVKTPQTTSWGGFSAVSPPPEKEGMESNRCSPGNPFDRSWRYEQPTLQPTSSPTPPPRAPVLLGRPSPSQPTACASKAFTPTKPAFQASPSPSRYHPRRRNTQSLHVHFE